jgi:18S rRNA (guanine1575-N7)-methyltransferase
MSRPETSAPPELFYNDSEARKYDSSSRMIKIQEQITTRAMEMLGLPNRPCYILDIGCGSGLSGQVLEEAGHYWVGCDISSSMLAVASEQDSDTGDLCHADMGQGLPFRPATFDGIISISAIQWLCYSNAADQDPKLRLNRFFSSLYTVMKRDAKAILQFYPENPEQAVLIAQCASRVGFSGGIVVDYPNSTKAKKHYLCLSFERSYNVPRALTGVDTMSVASAGMVGGPGSVAESARHNPTFDAMASSSGNVSVLGREREEKSKRMTKNGRKSLRKKHSVEWIRHKKEQMRGKGKQVKNDSKYTGRKRPTPF